MQISSLPALRDAVGLHAGVSPGSRSAGAVVAASSPATAAPSGLATALPTALPTAAALSAQAVRSRDPLLNQRIAGAQQTAHFLAALGNDLEVLRDGLSARLARGRPAVDAQAEALRQVGERWSQRHQASAGGLDGQLDYRGPGAARVGFRIMGLDARSLQQGKRETLAFSFGAGVTRVLSARIDPSGDPSRDGVRQLADALAPAGVELLPQTAAGELRFSVAEADWPALRDSLAIRGEGMRFPAGAFHRVRAKAEPEAIDPAAWALQDEAAMRQTLNRVTRALDGVAAAREQVRDVMDDAAEGTVVGEQEAAAALQFSTRFAAMAERPDFDLLGSVLPALNGISRRRVESLLKVGE